MVSSGVTPRKFSWCFLKQGDWRLLCLYRGLAPWDWYLCALLSCHYFLPASLYLYEACPLLGQNRGQLSFCNLCLSYGSPQWTRTIVAVFCLRLWAFRTGTKAPSLWGPKVVPTSQTEQKGTQQKVLFPPSVFPPPSVLSLNPLSIIKGQDPEYQQRRIYILLDWCINIKWNFSS